MQVEGGTRGKQDKKGIRQQGHVVRRKFRNQAIDRIVFAPFLVGIPLRITAPDIRPGGIAFETHDVIERRSRRMTGIPVGSAPYLQVRKKAGTPGRIVFIVRVSHLTVIGHIIVFFAKCIVDLFFFTVPVCPIKFIGNNPDKIAQVVIGIVFGIIPTFDRVPGIYKAML